MSSLWFSLHLIASDLQSMIELSRTQDEEVGDGTTSVIILGMLGRFIFHLNSCSI